VDETLELLEGRFTGLAQGVADGAYALWLGSGISRDRLPGLDELIVKVLVFLHDRSDAENSECPYSKALEEAVDLAKLRSHERDELDLDQNPTEWPHLNIVVDGLTDKYQELLAIEINGELADYLIWEGVDVCETYGGDEPDCEHLCLAILALEGVVSEMVSANWDGLIEAAFAELAGDSNDVLRVVVLPDDLRGYDEDAMLLKVHGCAVLAKQDPEKYRAAIIGTRPQITVWPDRADLEAIRTKMRSLASTIPTLVIGLSIQDENLQQLFSKAAADLRWPWPADPPAHVFADEALGADQINVLRVVYGEDSYTANADEVKAQSLIRAFSKPLLTALVLFALCAKLRAYLRKAEMPRLGSGEREELEEGLDSVAHRLAAGVGTDHLGFVRGLVSDQRRALSLFREGIEPTSGSTRYARISRKPASQAESDPNIATNGFRELAAGLALLGRGETVGSWSVARGSLASGTAGALKIIKGQEETAVFFAANGAAALRLHRDGIADTSDPDTLIIHSTELVRQAARSPRPSYGRDGRSSVREVHLRDLLAAAPDLASLEEGFRQEAAL